jgi:hypothetical protein
MNQRYVKPIARPRYSIGCFIPPKYGVGIRRDIMKHLILIAALALSLQGCIPMAVGYFVGKQMAEDRAHDAWCAQNVGDPSCHP